MNNELTQLQDLILSSSNVKLADEVIDNVLPGKYVVLQQMVREEEKLREGNLFIVHEKFADESVSLNEYSWQLGGTFDFLGGFVKITDSNHTPTMKHEETTKIFADQMMAVIDNSVCFSMLSYDDGYYFNVLIEKDEVVGFSVEEIGSWINTPNVQLDQACYTGDLQTVRKLLTHPESDKRAIIDSRAFYFACTEAQKDIIAYLLGSSELIEHATIDETGFTILCHANPQIVQELVSTLPETGLKKIKEFWAMQNSVRVNKEIICEALKVREERDRLENDLNVSSVVKKRLKL